MDTDFLVIIKKQNIFNICVPGKQDASEYDTGRKKLTNYSACVLFSKTYIKTIYWYWKDNITIVKLKKVYLNDNKIIKTRKNEINKTSCRFNITIFFLITSFTCFPQIFYEKFNKSLMLHLLWNCCKWNDPPFINSLYLLIIYFRKILMNFLLSPLWYF